MAIEKTVKGGYREGAGRKKELPEGTKPTYFNITEEERQACKKLISKMREGKEKVSKDEQALEALRYAIEPAGKALYEVIKIYGGRKGFREAERLSKVLGVIAFKDAVQIFENEEYRAKESRNLNKNE